MVSESDWVRPIKSIYFGCIFALNSAIVHHKKDLSSLNDIYNNPSTALNLKCYLFTFVQPDFCTILYLTRLKSVVTRILAMLSGFHSQKKS